MAVSPARDGAAAARAVTEASKTDGEVDVSGLLNVALRKAGAGEIGE